MIPKITDGRTLKECFEQVYMYYMFYHVTLPHALIVT